MTSSDEGEIVEAKGADLKASSLPRTKGSSVDRRDRKYNRDSPDRDNRASRSPRGYKRGHDDYDARSRRRDAGRSDHDSRDDYKRSRVSYDDLDRSPGRDVDRNRSRDRYNNYQRDRRHRSRSPAHRFRHDEKGGSGRNGSGRRDSRDSLDYDYRDSMASSASRQSTGASGPAANGDAKSHKNSLHTDTTRGEPVHKSVHFAEYDSSGVLTGSSEPDVDYDYDNQEQFDEEAEIERRRKRREALLAKSSPATPLLLQAVGATDKVRAASPASDGTLEPETSQTLSSSKLQLTLSGLN